MTEWLNGTLTEMMKDLNQEKRNFILQHETVQKSVEILRDMRALDDIHTPMIHKMKSDNDVEGYKNHLDLWNPYSQATQLILYLYSMESFIYP